MANTWLELIAVVAFVPMPGVVELVDEMSLPGGGTDPGAGGVGGVIAVVLGLVGDVVDGAVGDVVLGLVGDVVLVLVGDVVEDAVGLIGDEVGFGFGLELGLYGCAVGACEVVPVVDGAPAVCAMAAVDSVAAMANAMSFNG